MLQYCNLLFIIQARHYSSKVYNFDIKKHQ